VPKTLGSFLDFLKENYPSELATVSRPIKPAEFEVSALLEKLDQEKSYPAVLFNDPANVHGQPSGIKLVSNIFATRERCALAFGMNPADSKMPLSLEYARRENLSIPPEVIRDAVPVQEVVQTGANIDVAQLPIVKHYEMDLGPVLTMTCCMRDPDTGVYDISFIKNFYKGKPDYMGVSIHSPHLERMVARYNELGEPAPIITILGHHPAFYLGVLSLNGYDRDDYELVGGFLDEPLRLAPSVTWGDDFMVPADAELVIEGELLPGVKEVVDPFGEVTRMYQAQCIRQAMQVKAITRKREAIMQNVFSGHQGHWSLGGIPKEGSVYNTLQSKVGGVTAVHNPHSGIGRVNCYISIKKTREYQAKQTALAALTESHLYRVIIVVDDDIDVYNEEEVIWAALTYVNPRKDVSMITNAGSTIFTSEMGADKVIIDATKPLTKPVPPRFQVPSKALEAMDLQAWLDQRRKS